VARDATAMRNDDVDACIVRRRRGGGGDDTRCDAE
jgi:hypothetical protein